MNEYKGYTVPTSLSGDPISIDRVTNISAEELFNKYISRRRPVIISESHKYMDVSKFKDMSYLNSEAGTSELQIEQRKCSEGFGKGLTVPMQFGSFLDMLRAGDSSVYLTSQQLIMEADGFPGLLSPPLHMMESDINLTPSIIGHLIPQQV